MKVWEAIEMLQGMDGNKEVTVTIGKPKTIHYDPKLPQFQYPRYNPQWVEGSGDWHYPPNTVTCTVH